MIIDFHTHTFPPKIAAAALDKLSDNSGSRPYSNGMIDGLQDSIKKSGIDMAVVLPVATSPSQYETINRVAIETNEHTDETGILSFGGIHPDNDNYKDILSSLKNNGVKGIKLHPVYQNVNFDDIRMKRIVYEASSLGLITLVHAGYDIGFPGWNQAVPQRVINVIKDVAPEKLVLAHMGGWNCYEDVCELIAGKEVYLDTAFTINPIEKKDGTGLSEYNDVQMTNEQFVNLVRKHSADRILFGSDSPWTDQGQYVELVKNSGLTDEEAEKILGANAARLLDI